MRICFGEEKNKGKRGRKKKNLSVNFSNRDGISFFKRSPPKRKEKEMRQVVEMKERGNFNQSVNQEKLRKGHTRSSPKYHILCVLLSWILTPLPQHIPSELPEDGVLLFPRPQHQSSLLTLFYFWLTPKKRVRTKLRKRKEKRRKGRRRKSILEEL